MVFSNEVCSTFTAMSSRTLLLVHVLLILAKVIIIKISVKIRRRGPLGDVNCNVNVNVFLEGGT